MNTSIENKENIEINNSNFGFSKKRNFSKIYTPNKRNSKDIRNLSDYNNFDDIKITKFIDIFTELFDNDVEAKKLSNYRNKRSKFQYKVFY